jgi:hypothetical protein
VTSVSKHPVDQSAEYADEQKGKVNMKIRFFCMTGKVPRDRMLSTLLTLTLGLWTAAAWGQAAADKAVGDRKVCGFHQGRWKDYLDSLRSFDWFGHMHRENCRT